MVLIQKICLVYINIYLLILKIVFYQFYITHKVCNHEM